MRVRHIRLALIILFLVGQALLLGAMIATARYEANKASTDQVGSAVNHLSRIFSDNVTLFLQPAERAVSVGKAFMSGNEVNSEDDNAIEEFFLAELIASPQISSLFVGRDDGSFVFVNRQPQGFRTKFIRTQPTRSVRLLDRSSIRQAVKSVIDPADPYDPRKRSWYIKAMASDSSIWTEPYIFYSTQMPGITTAARLAPRPSRRVAVMGADVDMARLSSHLRTVSMGKNSSLHLEDKAGNVIAHPALENWIAKNGTGRLPTLEQLESLLPEVTLPATVTLGEHAETVTTEDGVVGVKRKLSPVPGVDWTLTMIAQTSELTGKLQARLIKGLGWILGASALAMLAAWFFLERLIRPISRIEKSATTDPLTGIFNRRGMQEAISRLSIPGGREGRQHAVMVFDLDGFKQINDRLGHDAGDRVLMELAQRVTAMSRKGDAFGRWGGDEFLAVVTDILPAEAAAVAERWRQAAAHSGEGATTAVGVTVGYALFAGPDRFTEALNRADAALVQGKKVAKNQIYGG